MTHSASSLRDLLRRAGIDPKKSLGQNFLADESYLDRIVETAGLAPDDAVLEIGAGLGTLTARLAARAGCVVTVELDDRLIPFLRGEFALQPHVHVVHGNILELEPSALMGHCIESAARSAQHQSAYKPQPYAVIANLPYYITNAVLQHLLAGAHPPTAATLMVQAEVAERVCSAPGKMSILSVAVQYYAEPSTAFRVPAGAFLPRPAVDSAVLVLRTRRHPAVTQTDPGRFFAVVRAGFGQKRKQLRNSLSAGLAVPKADIDRALLAAEIEPSRRAQTLSLADWARLTQALQS